MVNNILTPLAGRFPWNIYQPMYDWLKALKGRVGCETDCTTMWKPSEKQLNILNEVIDVLDRLKLFGGKNVLMGLKHDLKKLMEK